MVAESASTCANVAVKTAPVDDDENLTRAPHREDIIVTIFLVFLLLGKFLFFFSIFGSVFFYSLKKK